MNCLVALRRIKNMKQLSGFNRFYLFKMSKQIVWLVEEPFSGYQLMVDLDWGQIHIREIKNLKKSPATWDKRVLRNSSITRTKLLPRV